MKDSKKNRQKNLSKLELLQIVQHCKSSHRPHLFKFLDDKSINTLSEVIQNVLFHDLNLSKKQKRMLFKKYGGQRKQLKLLTNKSNSTAKKKKILTQVGGSLGAILGIALPILTSLFTK